MCVIGLDGISGNHVVSRQWLLPIHYSILEYCLGKPQFFNSREIKPLTLEFFSLKFKVIFSLNGKAVKMELFLGLARQRGYCLEKVYPDIVSFFKLIALSHTLHVDPDSQTTYWYTGHCISFFFFFFIIFFYYF